jgi:hypothetical protein
MNMKTKRSAMAMTIAGSLFNYAEAGVANSVNAGFTATALPTATATATSLMSPTQYVSSTQYMTATSSKPIEVALNGVRITPTVPTSQYVAALDGAEITPPPPSTSTEILSGVGDRWARNWIQQMQDGNEEIIPFVGTVSRFSEYDSSLIFSTKKSTGTTMKIVRSAFSLHEEIAEGGNYALILKNGFVRGNQEVQPGDLVLKELCLSFTEYPYIKTRNLRSYLIPQDPQYTIREAEEADIPDLGNDWVRAEVYFEVDRNFLVIRLEDTIEKYEEMGYDRQKAEILAHRLHDGISNRYSENYGISKVTSKIERGGILFQVLPGDLVMNDGFDL